MSFFNAINISATGLTAERLRMDIISKNVANAYTTKTSNGLPYRRQVAVFKEKEGSFKNILDNMRGVSVKGAGVEVSEIKEDKSPFKRIYNPGHPEADEKGYVLMPNVDTITEMVNLISASRAYEANVTALNTTKGLAMKALEIGR